MKDKPPALQKVFFQSLVAAFTLGTVSYIFLSFLGPLFGLDTFWGVLGQGLIAGIAGIIAATLALLRMGNPEIKNVIATLNHRFNRTINVAPSPEDLR